MNGERRMAFFTAVNIDGANWVHIIRKTGQPKAEATEKWYEDPRIDPLSQSDQSLYSSQEPFRVFDRGHLVRRQDPAWGTNEGAIRANADTFHFANCVPQQKGFNQKTRYWQGIEKYVLDNAKAERMRINVFTGPVFAEDDPDYRYVKVPRMFWKIIIRVDNGDLLATAFLADQSSLITRLPERLSEGFDDLSKVDEYQTTVTEIEELTGLDFGELRDHDTFESDAEDISPKFQPKSYSEIKLANKKR